MEISRRHVFDAETAEALNLAARREALASAEPARKPPRPAQLVSVHNEANRKRKQKAQRQARARSRK